MFLAIKVMQEMLLQIGVSGKVRDLTISALKLLPGNGA
jgi:hypothetical protein